MVEESEPRKLVIAGGSGYLGQSLTRHLLSTTPTEWQIVILSRSRPTVIDDFPEVHHAQWDGLKQGDWTASLEGCTHVLNLAGRSVDCRKTPDRCDEILRSRKESTRVLGDAISNLGFKPRAWVQMSTAHIYGDPPHAVCDESSSLGYGLAPTVGRAWEAAFEEHCPAGIRKVILRTSFVIGRSGGAFPILRRVAELGLGGRMGEGTQGISWIHEHDMNRVFEDALTNPDRRGMYIATAPDPVSYVDFMRTLRKGIRQPIALPGSKLGLKLLCATLMDSDPELILYGRRCVPKRLIGEGFEFRYPRLADAVADLLRDRSRKHPEKDSNLRPAD